MCDKDANKYGTRETLRDVMAYSAITVANEFLRQAAKKEPPIQLTPLKLLKLVYITHGWSLNILGRPLLCESAEAWQYGPVVPSLYSAIRDYRANPVDKLIPEYGPNEELEDNDKRLIGAVLDTYGRYSGTQLSNMTHTPNTPWSKIWSEKGRNSKIPNELIAEHYAELAKREAPSAP